MFSQTQEYALRAVIYLARAKDEGPIGVAVVAEATKVPPSYLAKVLQMLVAADILASRRGVGGGFSLVADPDLLSPLAVINAVDPIRRIESCPLGLVSHGINLCPLHHRLDGALAHIEAVLDEASISEMMVPGKRPQPLLETEPPKKRATKKTTKKRPANRARKNARS